MLILPEISLYVHVPFCTKKCHYCHFYVIPDQERYKPQLLEGLLLEWDHYRHLFLQKQLRSIYFGGGTPFLFGPERVEKFLAHLRKTVEFSNNIEITIEANPENVTLENMLAYAQAGINRVSLGVQTFDKDLLKRLGRLHHVEQIEQAIEAVNRADIENLSIDLMYDLPGQTLQAWQETLKRAVEFPITHLSLYNLVIEPHTVFFKYQDVLQKELPDPQTSLRMYEMACSYLEKYNLKQYEISAFAKKSRQSVHNSGYWIGREFLGIGPSAYSYIEGKRFRNIANLNRYCRFLAEGQLPIDFEEKLELRARQRELLAIALRLKQGVDLAQFEKRHGNLEPELFQIFTKLIDQQLLHQDNQYLYLTSKGILFYDTVATEII